MSIRCVEAGKHGQWVRRNRFPMFGPSISADIFSFFARLTLIEDVFTKEQHRVGVPLHPEQVRRGGVRPRPEDPALAVPPAVHSLRRGGQDDAFVHEWQQGEERLTLGAGRQRGRRLRQRDAWKPAVQGGRSGRHGGGGQVGYPDVGAVDLTAQHFLSQVMNGHIEGVLGCREHNAGED